jgi:hypothetical protein
MCRPCKGSRLDEGEDRMAKERGADECPRCRSPRTAKCEESALIGYRKCIICGNCWCAEDNENSSIPKERSSAPQQGTKSPNQRGETSTDNLNHGKSNC